MNRWVSATVGVVAFGSSLGLLWLGVADAARSPNWTELQHARSQTHGPDHVESRGLQPIRSSDRTEAISVLARSASFTQLPTELRAVMLRDAATDFRPLIIEGEQRGVTFTVPLTSTVFTSGPWTKVDKNALLAKVTHGAPAETLSSLESHDDYDALLSRGSLSASDYRATTFTSAESVDAIEVAVDLSSGTVLRLGPQNLPNRVAASVGGSGPVPREDAWGTKRRPPPRLPTSDDAGPATATEVD